MRKLRLGLAAAALAAAGFTAAQADEVVVYHSWSTPSEIAALNVLKSAWEPMGHTWKDLAIVHDSGVNVSLINMITGGNPPAIFMNSEPGLYRQLNSQGLGYPLTKIMGDLGVTPNFPAAVLKNITVDGEIMKAPVALHIDGMVYYNKDVAAKAGVDPTAWKSMDDLFADFDKVKAAGFIPIAQGGDKFQIAYLLQAVIAAETGNAIYDKFYGGEVDRAAIDSPEMRQSLERFRQIQQHVDPGSPNRKWNDTTNLVITGKALLQIHGDWMKGEWRAAGKEAGKDFGCINIPAPRPCGDRRRLGFSEHRESETRRRPTSRRRGPKISRLAAKKGSSPVRIDADQTNLTNATNRCWHIEGPEQAGVEPVQYRRCRLASHDLGRGRQVLKQPERDARRLSRRCRRLRLDLLRVHRTPFPWEGAGEGCLRFADYVRLLTPTRPTGERCPPSNGRTTQCQYPASPGRRVHHRRRATSGPVFGMPAGDDHHGTAQRERGGIYGQAYGRAR
jgi:glucose/mannose transport system substrate-binding protein